MRLPILPTVVKNLLIINAIMLLLTWTFGPSSFGKWEKLNDSLGMHYIGSPMFKPWQVITHMFMHGSITHLFFNMFALFMFGAPLENRWGPKRFLVYYLLTGLGAVVLHSAVVGYNMHGDLQALAASGVSMDDLRALTITLTENTTQFSAEAEQLGLRTGVSGQRIANMVYEFVTPMVGASGAVFGILLAFGMLFPDVRLMLLFPPIPIKAKYFVIGYGLIELYMGFSNDPGDNVAHFAHLGGMLFGFLLIKHWRRTDPFL